MKAKDLRNLSQEDLGQKEKALKKDLFDLRYQRKIGRVERPSMFKLIKRDIARIQTILNERKNDGNKD
ncbi:MAG TPA: 50S ribosomal protein L29 [Candidatus Omnitrophota bacterium]|jgi:large subunit ribosomal protein L29|nr:50S ribosomal protein L29 [Candidatus Omnitrophota bacterium]HPN55964.1 50S ribosomal protein L29 [Candidatus Omnitrophota bacterium]